MKKILAISALTVSIGLLTVVPAFASNADNNGTATGHAVDHKVDFVAPGQQKKADVSQTPNANPQTPAEQADGCDHGATGKPCRPDPQPEKGKDCLFHGANNVGGVNEDHCAPATTTTTVPPTTTTTVPPTTTTTVPPTTTTTVPPTTTTTVPPVTTTVPKPVESLPFTGGDVLGIVVLGGGALLGGTGLVGLKRKLGG